MPVEAEKRVEELAKNGNGLAILGEDDERSEIFSTNCRSGS